MSTMQEFYTIVENFQMVYSKISETLCGNFVNISEKFYGSFRKNFREILQKSAENNGTLDPVGKSLLN